jgi:hypothetical protein
LVYFSRYITLRHRVNEVHILDLGGLGVDRRVTEGFASRKCAVI